MKAEKSTPLLRLDTVNQCLWRGSQPVSLTPKAFAILRYLMDRSGQLVTKEELLNAAWPEVYVGDAALKVCIHRLRQTLGDETHVPRFIETVPWRGYRFIGAIDSAESRAVRRSESKTVRDAELRIQQSQIPNPKSQILQDSGRWTLDAGLPLASSFPVVGRDSELSRLHELLEKTLAGERQAVFLMGESGIGKSALVETFVARVSAAAPCVVMSGQCIEHYGTGEPYLPILEALEQLCQQSGNERFISVLRQRAPLWLMQMPSLISAAERGRLRRALQGTSPERMLREFAEALTKLTAEKPLLLVIEDLHWSDSATLDLLAFLTRRHHPLRLFFIGTYRPDFITQSDHSLPRLLRELSTHGQCHTIALEFLSEAAVRTYMTSRFPGSPELSALAPALHQRTDGNPLFLVNVIEYLIAQGLLHQERSQWQLHTNAADIQTMVPTNIQQLIEMQIDRLSPDQQQFLEVASVAGSNFSAAATAAALGVPIPAAEEQYAQLARRFHFLRSLGASESPDGTVAQQYTFIHSLYQNIFYQRIPAGTRVQWHARIGHHQEQAYGPHASEVAGELAMHFEHGRDFHRAVQYRRHAAETALQRHAYREAIEHFTIGLEMLKAIPHSGERVHQEIALCSALGTALTTTQGYASSAVERTYSRAHALWQHAGSTAPPFPVLLGLWSFSQVRAEFATALTQAQQLLGLANAAQDPLLLSRAHNALGTTLFWQGNLLAAKQQYEDSNAIYDPSLTLSADCVHNPGVIALSSLSVILAYCGDVTQAHRRATEALTLVQQHEHHYSLALARCHITAMHQVSRDFRAAQEMATAAMALATEKGFPYCLACSTIQYGWARAMQTDGCEGIDQITQGIAAYQATGAVLWEAYFSALLAEAQLVAGHTAECLHTLSEGLTLAQSREQLLPQIELYRIKGELLLTQKRQAPIALSKEQRAKSTEQKTENSSRQSEAESCFQQAIDIARAQQAKTLERRATLRLARLWQQQGQTARARHLLSSLCNELPQAQDTTEAKAARALLADITTKSMSAN